MIEIYFKSVKDIDFEKIQDYRVGSWINVSNTTMEDLSYIAKITNIDINDIVDSLDKYEIPRIEHINGNVVIFSRHSSELEEGLHTTTLTIVLTDNFIITISPQKSKIIDGILTKKIDLATTQKSKLLLNILLKTSHDFTLQIKQVRNAVINQEYKMKKITNEAIVVLTKNEEKLNQYLSCLVPLKNLLEAIFSGRYLSLHEKDYELLQDLMIGIKQSEDICYVSVKSIRSLRDSYQIQLRWK